MYGGGKRLSENRTLISEVLDEAGYNTAGFHSNPYLSEEFNYNRGFDEYFDSIENKSLPAKARQFVKDNIDNDGLLYRLLFKAFKASERTVGVEVGSPFVDAKTLTDLAIEWIESNASEPAYLWVHYMDVHHPYLPPEEHQHAIRGEVISDRESVKLRRKMLDELGDLGAEDRQKIIDLYDAEIRHMDAEVGRLMTAAESEWGDVVTAFTSDHGEELGDHGGYSHHMPKFLDEYIHVPLFIDAHGDGDIYNDVVGLVDVAPTLVEFAGADQPETYVGTSLRHIQAGDEWERDHVIAEWQDTETGDRNFAYRDGEWTYVYRENGTCHEAQTDAAEEELYAVEDSDAVNVVDDHPEVRDELRSAVDTHIQFVDSTEPDAADVEMGKEVQQRLQDLGYKE
jgi:arylsulfatase A-like enzyme